MPDVYKFSPAQILPGSNATNVFTGYPWRPVPGQLLQTNGNGQFPVRHIGIRGSLTAEIITGAAGTARAVIKLTSALANPQDTVQISLDTQNRPVLTIAYDGAATITATTSGGSALPAGSLVQVQAIWDSVAGYATFKRLNGGAVAGSMGSIPKVGWGTVPMGYVLVGYGASLAEFNGVILNLQVGDQVF
jgi:hypothetical protein